MPIFYFLLLLVTSLMWAGNIVISKTLVDHASPMTLTSLRWIIAVVCLIPIVWWKEKKLVPPKSAILPLFLMGITGVVLFNLFQFLAVERTSATNVGLITTLNAISIAVFSAIFLKEKMNSLQMGAMMFSLFGVLLVLSKGNIEMLFSLTFNQGDVYMLIAVAIWGLYSVLSKWATTKTTPMVSTLYAGIFGLLVLLPFNAPTFTVKNIDTSFTLAILYTGVISTVVCMVFWSIGLQKLGASTAGNFMNFNPVFTALLAFLFLGEQMTGIQFVGSGIVIFGCYLFSYFKDKPLYKIQVRKHMIESEGYR
ncbi:DMT family transporter [Bacillus sp. FJAT-47783]|uniref:DMT family transporter n=1 Tax=Bacillus sp. FJAT-47783 TaxID=2922712 RepID=UPI001FABAFBD|nr:DMT family transporter [Bacillus sp. FJAT-47783]